MRRALLATAAAGAILAPPAAAHVTVSPAGVEIGATQRVALEVPNERDAAATTTVVLEVPPSLEVVGAEPPDGWTVSHDSGGATWTENRIEGADVVDFTVDLRPVGPAGSVSLDIRQGYDDGSKVTWTPSLTILPAASAVPKQHLGRALVASVAGLGIVAGSLLVLHRMRRGRGD